MAPSCSEDEYVNFKSVSEIKFHQVKVTTEISFGQTVLLGQCDSSMTFWRTAILVEFVLSIRPPIIHQRKYEDKEDTGRPVIKLTLSDQSFFFEPEKHSSRCYVLKSTLENSDKITIPQIFCLSLIISQKAKWQA